MAKGLNDAIAKLTIDTKDTARAQKDVAGFAVAVESSFSRLSAAVDRHTEKINKSVAESNARINKQFDQLIAHVQYVNTPMGKAVADIDKMFGFATQKTEKTISRFEQLTNRMNTLSGSVSTFASLLGGKTIIDEGAKTLTTIATIERRFTSITGSQEKAAELMEQIRKEAEKFGQSSLVAQQNLIALVPNLKGGTEELEKFTNLSLRLASTNQEQGLGGAVRAINEALSSGELTSLVDRFNLSRATIREALKETGGDFAAALDIVLNRMGATEEAAIEAGKQFDASGRLLQESFQRAAAEGLKPFLDLMGQIMRGMAEFIDHLRETNPGILNIAAGLTTAITVGSGFLLVVTQIANMLKTISTLAPGASAALGKLGATGLAVGGGVGVGLGASRFLADRGIGDQRLRSDSGEDPLDVLVERIKQIAAIVFSAGVILGKVIAGLAFTAQKVFDQFLNIIEYFGLQLNKTIAQVLKLLGTTLTVLGSQLNIQALKDQGGNLQTAANVLDDGDASKRIQELSAEITKRYIEGFTPTEDEKKQIDDAAQTTIDTFLEAIGLSNAAKRRAEGDKTRTGRTELTDARPVEEFTQEQVEAWADYREKLDQIDEEYKRDSLREEADFQAEQTQKEKEFNLKRKRDLDDEMQRRKRAGDELDRDIEDVLRKGTEREIDLKRESETKITEITEKASIDEQKRIQDHYDKLSEIERDARESILDSARNLDAEGIRKAVQQREDAITEENKKFQRGTQDQQQELQRRITEEKKSYERRIEEGRIADQRAIDQLKRRFADEEAMRIADFNIKRQRELDDWNATRAQENIEHAQKMQDMRNEAQRERDQALADFQKDFDEHEKHENRKLLRTKQFYQAHENALDSFITSALNKLASATATANSGITTVVGTAPTGDPSFTEYPDGGGRPITRFAAGGKKSGDGLAYLEDKEVILGATGAGMIEKMLGQAPTAMNIMSALSRGRNGGGVHIQHFNPVLEFGDIGNYSHEQIYDIAVNALQDTLEGVVNSYGT